MAEQGTNMETWKNDMAGYVGLRRLDHRGELTRVEMIEGGRTFHITTEERRLNSEDAASPDQDFFRNGRLTPVRLLEDSEDAKEIAANPNIMSESDMRSLVKSQWKQFESRVHTIRNVGTLERLLVVAHEEDATIRKVEILQAQLAVVSEPGAISPGDAPGGGSERRAARPVTPR